MSRATVLHRILQDRTLQTRSRPILSAAMLLRYSLDQDAAADAIEAAVKQVLKDGYRTVDIMSEGCTQVGTEEMGARIAQRDPKDTAFINRQTEKRIVNVRYAFSNTIRDIGYMIEGCAQIRRAGQYDTVRSDHIMKSDAVKKGIQQAPHRSLFNALGLTEEEMKRPLIGIVNSYNEIVPGHMNLDKITEAVKMGVAMAGGVPRVFPAIAVCDGIAMGHVGMKYSLVTRDLIADSTECMAIAHQFDALVMIPNCDKNVPGLLMAAARLNIPTIFVSGGPMLAGHVHGRKRSLSSYV